MRDFDARRLYRHHRQYWRWNSGLSDVSYLEIFDRFTEMTRASNLYTAPADEFYTTSIRPYVTDRLKQFRDPLRLLFIVNDPLIVLGWVGLIVCFWPRQKTTLLVFAGALAVIYVAAAYAHIFGDNRHAHPLLPIIIVGIVKVMDELVARRRPWMRFSRRGTPSSG
jgi:hypothetical protein